MPHQSCERCIARQEMLLSLQQPRSFHQGLSVGEISQKETKLKPQRGDGTEEGSPDPSRKGSSAKWHPRTGHTRCRTSHTDSLLESQPFPAMVWGKKCSQGQGQWRELHGPPQQWCADKYNHTKFH